MRDKIAYLRIQGSGRAPVLAFTRTRVLNSCWDLKGTRERHVFARVKHAEDSQFCTTTAEQHDDASVQQCIWLTAASKALTLTGVHANGNVV